MTRLPPENATGNFVKVVQRLPMPIDLVDGNPTDAPLFVGLSVEPFVKVTEPSTGPFAGQKLQRFVQPTLDCHSSALPVPPSVGPTGATAALPEAGEMIPIAREPSS